MRSLFFHNDNVYVVLRALSLSYVLSKDNEPNMELLKLWKEYLGVDHVLKTASHYLICETVQEPEWHEIETEEQ
jgi:histidinol phosphatase-like PHP family hydrolase